MLNNLLERIKGAERLVKTLQSDRMEHNMHSILKSKTRITSAFVFTAAYWLLINQLRKSENECYRLAGAGSLMTHIVELTFYPLDTINSNSKVC